MFTCFFSLCGLACHHPRALPHTLLLRVPRWRSTLPMEPLASLLALLVLGAFLPCLHSLRPCLHPWGIHIQCDGLVASPSCPLAQLRVCLHAKRLKQCPLVLICTCIRINMVVYINICFGTYIYLILTSIIRMPVWLNLKSFGQKFDF